MKPTQCEIDDCVRGSQVKFKMYGGPNERDYYLHTCRVCSNAIHAGEMLYSIDDALGQVKEPHE